MKNNSAIVILIAYSMLLMYWMLFGFGRTAQSEYLYNILPFATIIEMFQYYSLFSKTLLINIVGNVIVFVPFGILLPTVLKRKRNFSFLFFIIGLTILEMTQLLLRRGSLDIDDFILNSIGFLIGYMMLRKYDKWLIGIKKIL